MSRTRQLTCAQCSRTEFYQKSWRIKHSFESTTSSHLFPLGYQQKGLHYFSTIQTIDYNFRFFYYQFSVVTIFRDYLANQVAHTKIGSPWRLKWSQHGGLHQLSAGRTQSFLTAKHLISRRGKDENGSQTYKNENCTCKRNLSSLTRNKHQNEKHTRRTCSACRNHCLAH